MIPESTLDVLKSLIEVKFKGGPIAAKDKTTDDPFWSDFSWKKVGGRCPSELTPELFTFKQQTIEPMKAPVSLIFFTKFKYNKGAK